MKRYSSKLYASNIQCTDENVLDKIGITDNDIPKISCDELNMCQGIVTIGECVNVIKAMSNGKSSSSDGYPIQLYKTFWQQIGSTLVKSYNYTFSSGQLSLSQRRGVITLIPKDGKDDK